MAKARDTLTPDLFDWQPPEVAVRIPQEHVRGGPLRSQIARALSQAMSQSGKSREQIAMDMSEFLGAEITKNMLDAYASPSRDEHRIPIDRFIALIFATEGFGLLGFMAEQFGFVVVPEKYSALIELHLIDEQMERQSQRKAALLGKWKAGR